MIKLTRTPTGYKYGDDYVIEREQYSDMMSRAGSWKTGYRLYYPGGSWMYETLGSARDAIEDLESEKKGVSHG